MSQIETAVDSSAVAVYPDHGSAEAALRRLIEAGFAMKDVSIVGRDFQVNEKPIGFITTRDFAAVGAGTGAWVGGLFGLLIGAAFLVLPGVGPVIVAGPLSAALLGRTGGGTRRRGARRSLRSPGRLGCSQEPGAEIRGPGQGRQVPRHRARDPRADREGQVPALNREAGRCECVRGRACGGMTGISSETASQ